MLTYGNDVLELGCCFLYFLGKGFLLTKID